jgi:hypothetical protein
LVRCDDCGGDFELSTSHVRHMRAQGRELRCRSCRTTGEGPQPTEAHRRWWLDRFSLDEIRFMASAFWPADGAAKADRTPGRVRS